MKQPVGPVCSSRRGTSPWRWSPSSTRPSRRGALRSSSQPRSRRCRCWRWSRSSKAEACLEAWSTSSGLFVGRLWRLLIAARGWRGCPSPARRGVGRRLRAQASDRLRACRWSWVATAPWSIVFDDADVDDAVQGALIAKMRNIGEACTAANRFHVAEPIAAQFAEKLAEQIGAMKVGRGTDRGRPGRAADRRLPAEQGRRARRGRRRPRRHRPGRGSLARRGGFFDPTVLTDVPDGAELLQEEIFGPVAPVKGFSDEDERGDRGGQQHRIRSGGLRLHEQREARPARRRAPRDRHGRSQPGHGLQPGRPVRWDRADRASVARVGPRGSRNTWRRSTLP